jgi:hypothetical protein
VRLAVLESAARASGPSWPRASPWGDPAHPPLRPLRPGPARGAGRPAGPRPGPARPAGRPDQGCAMGGDLRHLQDLPQPRRGGQGAAGGSHPAHEFGFAGADGQTAPILTRDALNVVAGYLAGTTARDGLRAGNVVAGSQVAALIMQAFGLRELVLAPWALREGVILETLAELSPAPRARPVPPTRAAARCWTSPGAMPGTRPTAARSPLWPCHCSTRPSPCTAWGRPSASCWRRPGCSTMSATRSPSPPGTSTRSTSSAMPPWTAGAPASCC